MSRKAIISLLVSILVIAGGVFIWRVQDIRAKDAIVESSTLRKLTGEEIALVLTSQADAGAAAINESAETRQAFLRGMREYLALASAARREGLTADANFQVNFAHKKNILLGDLYREKLGPTYVVPSEESEAIWASSANEKQFETDMNALQSIQAAVARTKGNAYTPTKLQAGSLAKARENWARTKVLSDRAKLDKEFMAQPVIELRTKILEAGILSADYLRKHWAANIKASDADIVAYLAAHPEYDVNLKRQRAETVLRRALAGEDFDRLAAEFSEDRSTKSKGGLYEDVEKDTMWIEVETAALELEKGRVADRLIESNTGYHIIKLENKQITKSKDGGETVKYSFRHVLLQKNFEEPGSRLPDVPPPFVKAEEIAKKEVEKEKRNKFVERIIAENEIILPEDFQIAAG